MTKRPKKKQKTSKRQVSVRPLGAKNPNINLLTDDLAKDDEERQLESMLFGTKFLVEEDKGVRGDEDGDEDDWEGQRAGQEMANLMDSDLFFIDEGLTVPDYSIHAEEPEEPDSEHDSDESEGSVSGNDSDTPSSSSSCPSFRKSKTCSSPKSRPNLKQKPPAWIDSSDSPMVAIASAPRLRKLRDAADEVTLSGREYESRLRRQFERIYPEPEWAKKARSSRRAAAAAAGQIHEAGDDDGIQDLLSSTAGILAPSKGKTRTGAAVLASGTLAIERLRDANQAVQGSGAGPVKVVAFHPSHNVPVLCVGTTDRRVRLFHIDGHTSPLLQTLHIPSLPLTSQSSVSFHPLGSSLLLTGPRPFFFTHDLQTGNTIKHARGLWGTTFNSLNDSTLSIGGRARKRGREDDTGKSNAGGGGQGMEMTAFSPYPGDMLAVAGRGGYVHLVDWKSGAGQVIGSLKCGGGGGGVRSLWWAPDRGNVANTDALGTDTSTSVRTGRPHLVVLSGDAEVYLWDVGERRCVKRWKDEGGFRGAGRAMAGTGVGGNGGWLAVGSNTGFVNVYGPDSFASPLSNAGSDGTHSTAPKPVKQVANLITSISTIRFNYDAQLMAIASREKNDAMRLIHLPSLTSFANWPTSSTPLGHVTAIDFSSRSEYLAVGNTRGRVLLYHLKDYGVGS